MMQTDWKRPSLVAALLTVIGFIQAAAYGQAVNTGTVVGTVTDQSGAVVPEARITLTDMSTHSARATVTNATGQYVFNDVPPGAYDIVVTKSGFESTKVDSQSVAVGTQTTANVKLHVGNESQTIEVTAEGVQLQTLNATVGSALEVEAIAGAAGCHDRVRRDAEAGRCGSVGVTAGSDRIRQSAVACCQCRRAWCISQLISVC